MPQINKTKIRDTLKLKKYSVIFADDYPSYRGKYAAFVYRKKLGKGRYGTVYLAHPYDIKNNKIDVSQKFAIKKFDVPVNLNQKRYDNLIRCIKTEAGLFHRYNHVEGLLLSEQDVYLVMEYIPGCNLFNSSDESSLASELELLTFQQRVQLILQIILRLNQMHHYTPSTGNAIIHRDLKGSNIRVNFDKKTGLFNIYLLDFGFSKQVSNEDDELEYMENKVGTPVYMPEEFLDKKVGIKSDVYALLPIIAIIFGAKQLFVLKNAPESVDMTIRTPYFYKDIFSGITVPDYPVNVVKMIFDLLTQMEREYEIRPSSDVLLRFFTSLSILCALFDKNKLEHEIDIYKHAAIMTLILNGEWDEGIAFSLTQKQFDLFQKVTPITEDEDDLNISTQALFSKLEGLKGEKNFYETVLLDSKYLLKNKSATQFDPKLFGKQPIATANLNSSEEIYDRLSNKMESNR